MFGDRFCLMFTHLSEFLKNMPKKHLKYVLTSCLSIISAKLHCWTIFFL